MSEAERSERPAQLSLFGKKAERVAADGAGDDLLDLVRLTLVPGVGPKIRRALLDRFGSSRAVLEAAPSELRCVEGAGPKLVEKIVAARHNGEAEQVVATCREHGVTIVVDTDPAYPRLLKDIHDPPAVLFLRGHLLDQDGLAVAIVGTRHATHYGLRQAERLGGELVRAGFTVVSGLARGIDGAAHRGAMEAGGRTLAVLGSGVLSIYPPEHEKLAARVSDQGALISEAPPLAAPHSGAFPQRNRIISGLALGTIIVEAGDHSGALITARHAMEQNREVFAVPGPVDSRASRGCHRLLRDGAKLVETVDDVLEELGPLAHVTPREDGPAVHHPAELLLNDMEQKVLAAVDVEPTLIDAIVTATGLAVPSVLSTISVLEMRRLVRRVSGNRVMRG